MYLLRAKGVRAWRNFGLGICVLSPFLEPKEGERTAPKQKNERQGSRGGAREGGGRGLRVYGEREWCGTAAAQRQRRRGAAGGRRRGSEGGAEAGARAGLCRRPPWSVCRRLARSLNAKVEAPRKIVEEDSSSRPLSTPPNHASLSCRFRGGPAGGGIRFRLVLSGLFFISLSLSVLPASFLLLTFCSSPIENRSPPPAPSHPHTHTPKKSPPYLISPPSHTHQVMAAQDAKAKSKYGGMKKKGLINKRLKGQDRTFSILPTTFLDRRQVPRRPA